MYKATFTAEPDSTSRKALIVRGGLPRTFGSLAGFLSLLLLCTGIYLLEDALRHPVQAADAALLFAGFVLGLAVILVYFLLHPRTGSRRKRSDDHREVYFRPEPSPQPESRQNQARGIAGK